MTKGLTPQQTADFYLSQMPSQNRFWWQTMEPERMKQLLNLLIFSNEVSDHAKGKLTAIFKTI
jgi:hypothetical protein